ncbi:MAG: cupin domain-containing protein [Deferribacterota bacterium]|nr:cupin domain-containing protein [Deferribacterota bacterium]
MIKLEGDNLKDVYKQVAIGEKEGWDDYIMRIFTLKYGGFTPKHSHPWPHINYIIKGKGILYINDTLHNIKEGFVAFIQSNTTHQFKNDGDGDFKFICIVPKGCDK